MSSEEAINDLVQWTLAGAGQRDTAMVRQALHEELVRVGDAHANEPSEWAAWADGADVIGTAYERLVSGADRRAKGQFQTPFWAADVMADWLLESSPAKILDPGVGAGRLLFRAGERSVGNVELEGFDIDPLCLAMADLNLQLRGLESRSLLEKNFLIDAVEQAPDAIICNPPYSRHHAIPADQKAAIHDGFEQRLGLRLNRLAALHVLFLIRSLEIVSDGGRIAFITPSDWLDVGYGKKIKRHVLDHAEVDAIILFHDDHLFFDGALTSAAITLLRKSPPTGKPTRVIRLAEHLPAVQQVLAAVNGDATDLEVEEVQLTDTDKWSRSTTAVAAGKPLSEFARIRRGIATGANKFFVVSEQRRQELGLSTDDLRPCITGPKLITGTELTAEDLTKLPDTAPRWAIECRRPEAEQEDTPLGVYLRYGKEELAVHAGYLASKRKPWYALERRDDVSILFTYMNRQRPRFIRNRAGAVPLNTFLIVEPKPGVDPDQLCDILNRSETIAQLEALRRNYGGGLWKLEPGEVSRLRVEL